MSLIRAAVFWIILLVIALNVRRVVAIVGFILAVALLGRM